MSIYKEMMLTTLFKVSLTELMTCLKYMPLIKKVKKYKFKFKEKPWITCGIQKSISLKNSFFKKYINKKDPHIKEELHQKYKIYRYIIAALIRKSITKLLYKIF